MEKLRSEKNKWIKTTLQKWIETVRANGKLVMVY